MINSIYFEHANAFEHALKQLDVDAEVIRIPYFMVETITNERLKNIRKVLKEKSVGRYLMFCPGLAEFFFDEPDQLFMFSAYRSWHDPNKIRVISHVWTTVKSPELHCTAYVDQ